MIRKSYTRIFWLALGLLTCDLKGTASSPPGAATTAYNAHIRVAEARLDAILQTADPFLWAESADRRAKLRAGNVICEPRIGKGEVDAPGGLIHDWVGAIFIPGVTAGRVVELLQDYDHHKDTYKPQVIASRLLERHGSDFRVRLRLLERKLAVTVVLDTDYDVRYRALNGHDFSSRSYSTRIVEVANAGTPQEREKSAREDRGYLWRLNSYWLFRERDGGTYVECEAVSLSRDIPTAATLMDPVVRSIIRGFPRGFLANTLRTTRDYALAEESRLGR